MILAKRMNKRINVLLVSLLMMITLSNIGMPNISSRLNAAEISSETDTAVIDISEDEENLNKTVIRKGVDGGVSWILYDDGFLDVKITGDLSYVPGKYNPKDGTSVFWPWVYEENGDCNYGKSIISAKVSGSGLTNADYMFGMNGNLKKIDLSNFDTKTIKSMKSMFSGSAITEIDLSNFDTRNVTSMEAMFESCSKLKHLDLSSFNTGKVKNMSFMFDLCSQLRDINLSSFNTSNVTNMMVMFEACESLQELDLSRFNTSNVTSMMLMFRACKSLQKLDLSSFDTRNVKDMAGIFWTCDSLQTIDISSFDMSKVKFHDFNTDSDIFDKCYNLETIKTPKKLPQADIDAIKLPATYYNKAGKSRVRIVDTSDIYTRRKLKIKMYRLYNPNSGEHFYSSNQSEINNIVAAGWKNEGIAWIAPEMSGTPVYRVYNPNAGDHHYTTSETERDNLIMVGWKDEGIGWYSDDSKGTALHRLYNPNAQAGSHHYTTSVSEKNNLVSAGWRYEGTAWYGMK